MSTFLTVADLPPGFMYPAEFVRVVECGLHNLEPWHILTGDALIRRDAGLKERYPMRTVVPFAYRQDNDDVACWDMSDPTRVAIVHDFASPGFESQGTYEDFVAWLRLAFAEFIEWME